MASPRMKLIRPQSHEEVVVLLIKEGHAVLFFDEGPHWSFKHVPAFTILTWIVIGEVSEDEHREILNLYHGLPRDYAPEKETKGSMTR